MKKLIDAVIFSNSWISLGAVSCTFSTFLFYEQPIHYAYLLIVFFMTFFGYNIQINSNPSLSNNRSNQTKWVNLYGEKMKKIALLLFVISIPIVICTFSIKGLVFSIPAFLAVTLYRSTKFTSFGLRSFASVKLFLIAFVWSWTCVVLPQILFFKNFDFLFPLLLFIYIIAITIPFDIRDLHFDHDSLKTIPQIMGIKGSFLTISILILLLLFFAYSLLENFKLIYFFSLTAIVLYPSYKTRNEYYYLFILDGLLLLFPIFVK